MQSWQWLPKSRWPVGFFTLLQNLNIARKKRLFPFGCYFYLMEKKKNNMNDSQWLTEQNHPRVDPMVRCVCEVGSAHNKPPKWKRWPLKKKMRFDWNSSNLQTKLYSLLNLFPNLPQRPTALCIIDVGHSNKPQCSHKLSRAMPHRFLCYTNKQKHSLSSFPFK